MDISWGPCCFCGKGIEPRKPDPCRITVETVTEGEWQTWFCHASCFRERLATLPDDPTFFEPAHF
jgi:hypothetical protein